MNKQKRVKKIILITVVVILIATICTGFLGYLAFADKLSAARSVKKLQDNLWYMEYAGDYGFDDFLENGGASSEEEMALYLISFMSCGFMTGEPEEVSLDFGCSALTTETEEGTLMGRNFDWEGDESSVMIIHTKPDNGYESYSTTWLDFLGFSDGFKPESFADKYLSMAAVYVPLDGINEKGLCVADLLAGDDAATNQQTERADLTTTSAIRLLLDKAADVDEAVDLLRNYDMHSSIGTSHHLAISDANGKSVVVEYIDDVMVVTETKAVTNHYLSEGEKYGTGKEESHNRFNKLLTLEPGINNCTGMKDCMNEASYEGETQWSIVYNLDAKAMDFYFHRDYDNPHHFAIN